VTTISEVVVCQSGDASVTLSMEAAGVVGSDEEGALHLGVLIGKVKVGKVVYMDEITTLILCVELPNIEASTTLVGSMPVPLLPSGRRHEEL